VSLPGELLKRVSVDNVEQRAVAFEVLGDWLLACGSAGPYSHPPGRLSEGRRRVGAGSRRREASVMPQRSPPQIQPRFARLRTLRPMIGFSRANVSDLLFLYVSSACAVLAGESRLICGERYFRRSAWPLRRLSWRFAGSGR